MRQCADISATITVDRIAVIALFQGVVIGVSIAAVGSGAVIIATGAVHPSAIAVFVVWVLTLGDVIAASRRSAGVGAAIVIDGIAVIALFTPACLQDGIAAPPGCATVGAIIGVVCIAVIALFARLRIAIAAPRILAAIGARIDIGTVAVIALFAWLWNAVTT